MHTKPSGSAPVSKPSTEASSEAEVLAAFQQLWQELQQLWSTRLRLAALETQQAGLGLSHMLIASALVALLLNGAWLGFMVAAIFSLSENGMANSTAVLLMVVANLFMALIFCAVIRHKSRNLGFSALRRSLKQASAAQHK